MADGEVDFESLMSDGAEAVVYAECSQGYSVDDILDAAEKMRRIARPPQSFIAMHPSLKGELQTDPKTCQPTLFDTRIVFDANVQTWKPPKSKSPYIEYGREDEHWMRPLGLGTMEPSAFECHVPRLDEIQIETIGSYASSRIDCMFWGH